MKPLRSLLAVILCALPLSGLAGAQLDEPLSEQSRALLHKAIIDSTSLQLAFGNEQEAQAWISAMSARLKKFVPDEFMRIYFLKSLHYEATRAGLDPQLVLGLIQVESGFKKYAISSVGARGYLQVMPFWTKKIGSPSDNLFDMQTNLRYGCTILRYYLNIEHGNLFRALGRYNGSLGQAQYPNMVVSAWKNRWSYAA